MKRSILILLSIIVIACSVNAMTTDLLSPSNENVSTDLTDIDITCKGTITAEPGEELDNLTLYLKNNESVEWSAVETVSSPEVESGVNEVFSVSLSENGTYIWNCLAVSNNTQDGGEGNQETWSGSNWTFSVTFEEIPPAENNAPSCTVADINITVEEDSAAWTLDSNLSQANNISCSDADDDALTYTIASGASGSYGSFTIPNGYDLVYTPSANQSGGIDIVTLTVSDGTDSVAISAQVTVSAVNDAPFLSGLIPNKSWYQDMDAKIDLDDYFSDIDDSSFTYNYTFSSSSGIKINVTIESDGDAVFTPDSGWTGTHIITFTAYDSENVSVTSNDVTLTVLESNQTDSNTAPNIQSYLPETNPTISVGESQTFSITKSDSDGDSMNVTWYVGGVVQEGETGNSFVYNASIKGSFVIKVAISDGQASDTNSWTLTVKEIQTKTPVVSPPSNKSTKEETSACGDGVCDKDETDTGCCKDCGCPESYTCNLERNKCTREVKANNLKLMIIIVILFGGAGAAAFYFYRKKQDNEIFGLAKTPLKIPSGKNKKSNEKKPFGIVEGLKNISSLAKKKEEVKEVKDEKPSVDLNKPPVTTKKSHLTIKGLMKKPLKKGKTTNQVLLKKYILYNLKKGKTLGQIKKDLLKVGWSEEQFDDAYTAAQLEDVFS